MTLQLSEIALENHRRFVERVAASGIVWGLKNAAGWAVCDSNGEQGGDVMPFWSDRAYAVRAAVDDWSDYEPTEIPIAVFIDRWLQGMTEDEVLVGTNWDTSNRGFEIAAAELAEELVHAQ